MTKPVTDKDKSSRGNASQFFVAGELCRRGVAFTIFQYCIVVKLPQARWPSHVC